MDGPGMQGPSMDGMSMDGMSMDGMSFQWSKYVTLLFSKWTTSTAVQYIFSLAAIFVLALMYQMLSSFRSGLVARARLEQLESAAGAPGLRLEEGSKTPGRTPVPPRYPYNSMKLLLTLLFGVNMGIGYLIMLCIMSFNGGVYLSVVVGLTVGYFVSDI